ncbi:MAG: pitrilysin family protein [Candidatus Caldatribacteriota bacterium]|nr:pitrilysin family protein [Candidatus Caldatribacteriota bacterium]
MRIIVKEMPYMKSVSIVIGIGAGSRYEEKKYQGISHLIEHMLFKGTRNRENTLEISRVVEGIGGAINASTSEENTILYVKVPQKVFVTAFDVLADIILNSLMRNDDLQREKNVVIEEIRKCKDTPEELVGLLLDKIMWKNHPLGRGILGDEKSVRAISREILLSYIDKLYRPNNMVISIAGKVKTEEVIFKVKKYFEGMENKEIKEYLPIKEKQEENQINIRSKKTNQTHLCFGFPTISRMHPDRYSVDLLDIILGSGLSSRLFQEIRVKRSMAYDVHSYVQYFNDIGSFNIYAGVDSDRLKESIKVILEELRKIRENDLPEEELIKAKEMYKGALSLNLESTLNQAFWLENKLLLYGKPFTEDEVKKKIEKVEAKDIIKSACKIFKKNGINLSIVGPFKEKDREELASLLQEL